MIICSASNETLEESACLACAMTGKAPCGYDYSLVKSILSDQEENRRVTEIHVTDITGCLRRAWYSKARQKPEYLHHKLARYIGKVFHASVEGADDFLETEMPLTVEGIMGKVDVFYHDGRLVDHKTTRWIMPHKLPYGSHSLQVNIYAHLLRKLGKEVNKLQIQYIDMSGPSKCRACSVPVVKVDDEFRCPNCGTFVKNAHLGAILVDVPIMDYDVIEDLVQQRQEALSTSLELGLPPAKEPGFLCSYCAHRDECQPNITEE